MEQRRREGMRLLGRGLSQAEVARRCGVSRTTALQWDRRRRNTRGAAWKRRPLGRPAKLSPTQNQPLAKALLQGAQAHGFLNDLWTLSHVAELIRRQTGVRLHPRHVWRLLGKMGWSVQRPEGKAVQRDEAAITRWGKHTWPALKKSPKGRPHDCLCGRKRAFGTAQCGAHLGAARPDAATGFQSRLGQIVGHRRHHLVAVLLPALSWQHQSGTGD